jgi:hemoglobin/transferrin/lactoferrin receptor protein
MQTNNSTYLSHLLILFLFIFINSTKINAQDVDTLDSKANLSTPLHLAKEKLTEADLIKTTFTQETRLISVSRSEKELKDIPSTVYVITREEILENGYITLVDVMKAVPWIKVSQPGSGALGEMFFMRGQIGNEYTKILINNVPIQPAVSGGLAISSQLPIAQAERIEIVYGPASAVYGADAVAGVINIITQTSDKSAYAQANAYFGTDNYRHIDFLAGGKAGRDKNVLQYSIYGNLTKKDDMNINKTSDAFNPFPLLFGFLPQQQQDFLKDWATNYPDSFVRTNFTNNFLPYYEGTPFLGKVDKLPEFSYLLGVKFNYRKLQVSVDEMYSRRHSSIGRNPAYFSYTNSETYLGETLRRIHISYQTSTKKYSFLLNAQTINYRSDANSSFGVAYNIGNGIGRAYKYEGSNDFFAEAIYTRKLNSSLELTIGTSALGSESLPTTNDLRQPFNVEDYQNALDGKLTDPIYGSFGYNPIVFGNGGAFFQLYYTKSKFVGIVGVRADYHSVFGGSFNPRLSVLYNVTPKFSLRASASNAFRAPSPSIRFASIAFPNIESKDSINYQQIPNPNLTPEYFLTFETGIRYFPSSKVTLDVIGYFSGTNSPITARFAEIDRTKYPMASYFSGNNNNTARIFFNDPTSKSATYGLQAMFKVKNIIEKINLDSDIFLSYTLGTEILPNDEGTINAYRMQPNFMGQWRISFRPSSKWYINFQNVLMSGWYRRSTTNIADFEKPQAKVDGYYTLDMLVRHYFNKNVSSYIRINNVFNADYGGLDGSGQDVDLRYNPQLLRNIQAGVSFRIN